MPSSKLSDELIGQHFDRMRGRLLGLIEACGLPPTQERAAKALFKSLSYDAEAEINDRFEELRQQTSAEN